jgi:DNA-binding HxlR family transcriptional regulator
MASQIKTSSSNAHNLRVLAASNDVNEILEMISPRWKMQILCSISQGVNQFSLLKERFPSLSDQVLGKRLSELVSEGLLLKEQVAGTVPQQTVYIHTKKAAALLEILLQLHLWKQKTW